MIRINLLPIRQAQKKQSIQQQLLIAAGVVLLTLIGCGLWTFFTKSTLEDRKVTMTQKKKELEDAKKRIGEVAEFEEQKKDLEAKLDVIEKLEKSKTGPVRALDDFSNEIPNRAWINSVKESGKSVTLTGYAMDPEDISLFMKNLEKSKYLSNVVLTYSKATKDKDTGTPVYEFKVVCAVDYSA